MPQRQARLADITAFLTGQESWGQLDQLINQNSHRSTNLVQCGPLWLFGLLDLRIGHLDRSSPVGRLPSHQETLQKLGAYDWLGHFRIWDPKA